MKTAIKSSLRGDATRDALLAAAMQAFARDGFHAVSLRGIAESADVNPALIGYHFRNKEGLYLAVFEHIVAQIRQRIGPIADAIEAVLAQPGGEALGPDARRERYLAPLLRLTDGLASLMAHEQSAPWSLLIMREQQSPTAAFAVLYDGFMARVLSLLAELVLRLREGDSVTQARLTVSTILGQVLVFRFARAGMLRHLQWERIGEDELAAIQSLIRQNVTAMFMTGG